MSADPDIDTPCPNLSDTQVSEAVPSSVEDSCQNVIEIKNRKRTVSFPADNEIVTQYFEPANPWQDVAVTSRAQLAAEYLESCRRHNTPPIDSVLLQIRELPETSIGGSVRAPRLSLSECVLQGPSPADALEAVLRKVQFKRLEIDHAVIDDEGAEAIFDMIEYYESALVVSIIGNRQFGIRGWQAASRMFKKSAELSELEISEGPLEAMHAPVLARALRPLTCRLRALCLQRTELSGEPLLCLVIALKSNTSVRELRLGDNRLSPGDASQIASLLHTNTRLQLLDLSNNQIQDVGFGLIATALVDQATHSPPSLAASPQEPEHHCPMTGGYEARGLAFLVLWNNQLTRNCAVHLSKALRSSKSLCVLNIGRNALGTESVRALCEGGALVSVGLQAARLGPDAASAVADLIQADTKLQRLDLRDNRLGAAGLQCILAALRQNSVLTQIDLDEPTDTSSSLTAEDGEAATVARLTREIRALCGRNEPAATSPERRVHRKISLTCHTACMPIAKDTSSSLTAEDSEAATVARLTREIRALCGRNEPAATSPERRVHRKISLTCHTACMPIAKDTSSSLTAEDSEAATVARLTRDIRALCGRNEPAATSPERRVHRKISLTCHTACMPIAKAGCASGPGGLGVEEERRGRLRSPAPSPAGSPIPSAHHSRFSVTRVTPERESSHASLDGSPAAPRPAYCTPPSRFKVVQVSEPPQIQVHPASSLPRKGNRFSVTRNYDTMYNPQAPPPSPAPDTRHHTPDTRPHTPDTRPLTPDTRPHTPDKRPLTPDTRPHTPDTRPHTPDTRPLTPDTRPHTPDTRPHTPDTRPVTPESRPETPNVVVETQKPNFDYSSPRKEPKIEIVGSGTAKIELNTTISVRPVVPSGVSVEVGPTSVVGSGLQLVGISSQTAGPRSQTAGPGSQAVGPHSQLPGPRSQQVGPGSQLAGPGSQQVGPGSQLAGPGSQQVGPGLQLAGPGSQQVGPGLQLAGPGSQQVGPGSQQVGPGSQRVGLGLQHVGPGSTLAGPGPQQVEPRSQQTKPASHAVPESVEVKNVPETNASISFKREHSNVNKISVSEKSDIKQSDVAKNTKVSDRASINKSDTSTNDLISNKNDKGAVTDKIKNSASETEKIDVKVEVSVKCEATNDQNIFDYRNVDCGKNDNIAMKQIEAITEDLGVLIREFKDLSTKSIVKKVKSGCTQTDVAIDTFTVPVLRESVLKKNKSESSLDSPDLEVSRLMNKKLGGSPFCDSSSSLEISGSSVESLNTLDQSQIKPILASTVELDRRKDVLSTESSIESNTSEPTPVNSNLLNMSVSSNESVSPIIFRSKKIHDSLSSLEASVSSLDSGRHEKVMVTSADSGIEYSLQHPSEIKEDSSSNEGTLTNNSSLKETVKKDLENVSSPKRTSSLLDVPAMKTKALSERMRKISWVAPSPSFHIPKAEPEKEIKLPSHLEKLLSLFQHPIFSRSSNEEEKKSASNTPPRKDSSLTSSFWSWGSATEKEREDDKDRDSSEATDSTLSERVQVSYVDESFSKKLDSKTPSTDTDNTLSEFQTFQNSEVSDGSQERVTLSTDNLVQSLVLSKIDSASSNGNVRISDNLDLRVPNDMNKNYETDKVDDEKTDEKEPVRPRSFAAVLKSSGSENTLDKQNSPESGQSVDKLPSKVIRGIKENISPENTLTNTKTLALELAERQKTQVAAAWEVPTILEKIEPKLEDVKVSDALAPIATIEETCDEGDNAALDYIDDPKFDEKNTSTDSGVTSLEGGSDDKKYDKVITDLEQVDLGKDALSFLVYDKEFLSKPDVKPPQGSLAQELQDAEILELIDLSPELVIDEAMEVPEVFTVKEMKGLKTSPVIPERAKMKKSNSLEELSQSDQVTDCPKVKAIAFKVPEICTTPRDIPERRTRLRTRSGSSPKSLPESLNKPCPLSKIDSLLSKKKKKVSSLGKMAKDSLLALNMSEDEIAEFRRSYKLTSVESLRSLESVSEDANSHSGNSVDGRCRSCLRTSQESLMSLDSITEDCRCTDDCEKPSQSNR